MDYSYSMWEQGRTALQRGLLFSVEWADDVHDRLDAVVPRRRGSRQLDRFTHRACTLGFVVWGILIALVAKACYETEAPGLDGSLHPFHKPWLMVMIMFTGKGQTCARLKKQHVFQSLCSTFLLL